MSRAAGRRRGRLALVAELLDATPGAFWPNQYANASDPAGTMREIDEALDGDVDYVFVATSTAGTLLGRQDYVRAPAEFDSLVRAADIDCVVGCRRLVAREAIFAGASSAPEVV